MHFKMKLYWMQPGEINSISGGYIYNKNIVESIHDLSVCVEFINPGTDFPFPSKKSVEKCRKFFQSVDKSSFVIVDSLILGTIPDLIEEYSAKCTVAGMIHLPLSLNPSFTENRKKYFKELEIKSFNYSKILFVTSAYTKSEIVKMGINGDKIHVVTPGINTIANQRNYPEKPWNLLCVSCISRSKGQLDLIKALENLQHFEWNLTLCGRFDENDEYFKKIKRHISAFGLTKRIVFAGEIPRHEIEEFYRQADLFILTSRFETYSMVLQEAMAFKIPIITANSGAIMQTTNSIIAKFYKPGNIAQLEKHLISVLSSSDEYKLLVDGYSKLNIKFLNWSEKAVQFLNIVKEKNGI